MNADAVLRVALVLTPRAARGRMSEEWRADLFGCTELGLSTAAVARGALRAATAARAAGLLIVLLQALVRCWTLPAGLVLGAACGLLDVPVIVVVPLALGLHGGTVAATQWRARASRSDPRSAEPTR